MLKEFLRDLRVLFPFPEALLSSVVAIYTGSNQDIARTFLTLDAPSQLRLFDALVQQRDALRNAVKVLRPLLPEDDVCEDCGGVHEPSLGFYYARPTNPFGH